MVVLILRVIKGRSQEWEVGGARGVRIGLEGALLIQNTLCQYDNYPDIFLKMKIISKIDISLPM